MTNTPLHTQGPSGGIPVAPSMGPALAAAGVRPSAPLVDRQVLILCLLAVGIAGIAGIIAQVLARLIAVITHLAYYGDWSWQPISPADNRLGAMAVLVPVVGGVVVGFMARYGSQAIRGHGIPEAMETVLYNSSRIPARMTFLKPVSSAIAIGTGGPFGAEGPIIATGGAVGSLVGQLLRTTSQERKTLLAAGAAAGMAATFGSPLSATLLAVELLLFEFRARSLIPVALAAVAATAVRSGLAGSAAAFTVPALSEPRGTALSLYVAIGAVVGLISVGVTRAVYLVEDAFEHVPVHWMWWPAIGGVAVGVAGLLEPHALGVGYDNIERIVGGSLTGVALVTLVAVKFVAWAIALGSGTSGGTLAPLLTLGGGVGALCGGLCLSLFPESALDPRMAALVGMAAMFAGASRALLASVVFAVETTGQLTALVPLLGGCGAAYLLSCMTMRNTIMTEKLERRGSRVPSEYEADHLAQMFVGAHARRPVRTLRAGDTVLATRTWLESGQEGSTHQGFPLVDSDERMIGVLTRRDIFDVAVAPETPLLRLVRREVIAATEQNTLRDVVDSMVMHGIGRLPVLDAKGTLVGIITRSDVLAAQAQRVAAVSRRERTFAAKPN